MNIEFFACEIKDKLNLTGISSLGDSDIEGSDLVNSMC